MITLIEQIGNIFFSIKHITFCLVSYTSGDLNLDLGPAKNHQSTNFYDWKVLESK